MPRFQYVALDARGQESTGSVEANSANEAIGHLRQAGYFPTGVYEQGKAPVARDGKVELVRVTPGHDYGDSMEILSGLQPTDDVILSPSDSLTSGTAVQISGSKMGGTVK